MPTFRLQERDLAWVMEAPVIMPKTFTLAAETDEVFEKLADLEACGRSASTARRRALGPYARFGWVQPGIPATD